MLTTDQKGAVAEAAIAYAALELGVGVWRPLADERCDLIFDLRPTLVRVQCKWASRLGDVIYLRCYRNRRNADGLLRQLYAREDVDAFAVYCAELRTCYFVLFDEVPAKGTLLLRLQPTRNNQKVGIRWAQDYEIEARLGRQGAVAQLGERRRGTPKATGSSPVGSTQIAASAEAALF
jgi:hypothetical protein